MDKQNCLDDSNKHRVCRCLCKLAQNWPSLLVAVNQDNIMTLRTAGERMAVSVSTDDDTVVEALSDSCSRASFMDASWLLTYVDRKQTGLVYKRRLNCLPVVNSSHSVVIVEDVVIIGWMDSIVSNCLSVYRPQNRDRQSLEKCWQLLDTSWLLHSLVLAMVSKDCRKSEWWAAGKDERQRYSFGSNRLVQ